MTSTIDEQSKEYQRGKFSIQSQHWPEMETATRPKKIATQDSVGSCGGEIRSDLPLEAETDGREKRG